jgi:hypothetical protein
MNTAHFVKAFTPTALGLTVAGVATPVLLFLVFLGRGVAQADSPPCDVLQTPAACNGQIAGPQPSTSEQGPRLSREWFRASPIYKQQF